MTYVDKHTKIHGHDITGYKIMMVIDFDCNTQFDWLNIYIYCFVKFVLKSINSMDVTFRFEHFKVIFSNHLIYQRNDINSYPSYVHITCLRNINHFSL